MGKRRRSWTTLAVMGSALVLLVPPALSAPTRGAPRPPTGLVAAPRSGAVRLSWEAPDANPVVTDYRILYRGPRHTQWQVFDDGVSTTTEVLVSGLNNGTAYSFRVAGVNADGIGGYAGGVESRAGTPTAPVSVRAESTSPSTISVEWSEPLFDHGFPVREYRVLFRRLGAERFRQVRDPSPGSPNLVLRDLLPLTGYEVAVQAANRWGFGPSSALQVVLTMPPPTPVPRPTPTLVPTPTANCSPSYPTVCIPPPPPDLDCGEIPFRQFVVVAPDPHGFDGDNDGVGCES